MFSYRTYRFKKMLPLFAVIAVLVYGLVFFAQNQDLIRNFKPYYYKSYVAAMDYKVSRAVNFVTGKSAEASSVTNQYATSVPVLLYHGVIIDHPDGANVQIDKFISQMLLLKKEGYNTISIEDYYNFIHNGKKLPDKSFLLTFDDGRKDSYYPAEPILAALHYKATMFVITGESYGKNSRFYLSPAELLKMRDSGQWELQAHTRNGHSLYQIDEYTKGHFYTNKLWLVDQNRFETDTEFQQRIHADLAGAKADIMNNLGVKSYAMAFPFGDIGDDQSNYPGAQAVLLSEVHKFYPIAFYQFYPARGFSQNYSGSKAFLNERINVLQTWTDQDLLRAMTNSDAKNLPFSVTPSTRDGWLTTWASTYFSNTGLILGASTKTTGASANLDGSYGWKDYSVKAVGKLIKGSSIKLLMRVQDNNNYASCSYSADRVQLQEVVNGTTTVLGAVLEPLSLRNDTVMSGSVQGNVVTCIVPGGAPLSARLRDARITAQGGIGFVATDPSVNNAEGIIEHVEVKGSH